jgi:hypothetical protein
MTIQVDEAASALKDAEATAGRAMAAHGYRLSSGYLMLWGVVWAVANVASQVSLQLGQALWLAGVIAGVLGSLLLGRRKDGNRAGGGAWKGLLIAGAIGAFGWGSALVSPPQSYGQGEAVACMAVGAIYIAMGASVGLRLSAVGAAIIAATLLGWFFARDYFFLWMAAAGGGGLILGGLWFRKV